MGDLMTKTSELNISQILALVSGFVALLYTFYYMQQLSYSIGIYSGITRTIVAYNLTNKTTGSALVSALSQSTTISLALHLTYAMLPFALLIFAIGIIWFFSRTSELTSQLLITSSVIFIIITLILELDFNFSSALSTFPIAYAGGALGLIAGGYSLYIANTRTGLTRRAHILYR